MSRLIDISPPLDPALAVWPGDTPLSRQVLLDMARGDNLTLSSLTATVHLGAHADAPSHYGKDAATIEQRALELYLGPCEVVRVAAQRGRRLGLDALPPRITTERVLFATGTFPDPRNWNKDFAAFEPALIDALASRGVRLVGIDTPSVDLFDSKDLPSHQALLRNDMAVLEGLVLTNVPAGVYELISLPLKLVGFDASPVRAVLRKTEC
ncbi:MAG: cyclase family protein [Phycisphaerae bacterium]|nr:cyclase family protein [Phycisphaerae bacterium]